MIIDKNDFPERRRIILGDEVVDQIFQTGFLISEWHDHGDLQQMHGLLELSIDGNPPASYKPKEKTTVAGEDEDEKGNHSFFVLKLRASAKWGKKKLKKRSSLG